jgi:hypothetical protein
MGQKFTPDEFGQDKIEKYWKTKFLKLKLAVCGRSGPAPGSVFEIRSRLSFQSNQQASTEFRDRQEIA